ncbi:MAG: strictosidine synthase family protein [Oligoflexales bacterium]|nr:strictosidine synthase family protein [Oligoflexales bacterium]
MRVAYGVVFIAVSIFCYLLFWPVSIDPVSWTPPENPQFEGPLAPNRRLSLVKRIPLAESKAPEDVAIDSNGRIYGGLDNGKVMRYEPITKTWHTFANTLGRPLGMTFDAAQNLIVCDAYKGLLSIDQKGHITVLSTQSEGKNIGLADDVDVAKDGIIYFSDASFRHTFRNYKADALEHRPNGRLLAYDPNSKETTTLLKELYFANGVAISSSQDYVLVNETWNYRVIRYWLKGPKKGSSDVFIDKLPGFPDGISNNGKGIFWIPLISPRDKVLDYTADKPFVRKIIMRLPDFLKPAPKPHAIVLGFNEQGDLVRNLQDHRGVNFSIISSAEQFEDTLYLGSLEEAAIGLYKLDAPFSSL